MANEVANIPPPLPPRKSQGWCKGHGTTITVTLVVLAIIGALIAMGATGHFTSEGWLYQNGFPAVKDWIHNTVLPGIHEFLNMKVHLTIGEGFLYIGLPIVTLAALTGLAYNRDRITLYLKDKLAEHQDAQNQARLEREQTEQCKAILREAEHYTPTRYEAFLDRMTPQCLKKMEHDHAART